MECSQFPIFTREVETLIHVLWECPSVVDVQGEGSNPLRKWAFQAHDFKELWSELVEKHNKKDLPVVATVCHNLWGQGNKVVLTTIS